MIITDRFVVLAFPKTGSSFIRRNLKRIHNYNSLPRRALRKVGVEWTSGMTELLDEVVDQHSPVFPVSRHLLYSQIPAEHRDKAVAGGVRDPFRRYISTYFFGYWKEAYGEAAREGRFTDFPDLDFEAYYDLLHIHARANRLQGIRPKIDLGLYTIQFIQFYFKEPDEAYLDEERYWEDMAPITFLRQENLNADLYRFLKRHGYPRNRIDHLLQAKRVNVTPWGTGDRDPARFYTPELVRKVLERDRLIFDLFPQYRESPQVARLLEPSRAAPEAGSGASPSSPGKPLS
jgi:hypothetical protein